jgi:tetratricopeptide (TPR) repeat protein
VTVGVGLGDEALTMAGPAAPDASTERTLLPPAAAPWSDSDAKTIAPPRPPVSTGGGDTELPGGAGPSFDTGPLAIGERFGARYRITRLLGVGGMGAVYEAWDGELGVSVALKVIRPEVAGDPGAAREMERRFKRELLLARQVTHKNVVRIHDLGEIDGIKYITMPYIEGDDLGSILKSEGRLAVPRALAILRQALSGLVAAHAAGIVHRDLKPANIMVDTDGLALLMDFGIARSIGIAPEQIHTGASRSAPGAFGDTIVGAVVGTIHYMAPEQAKAQQVDHRADIYAFGLILRDALIGLRRQESAPTALAELQKRLDAAPEPLRKFDATIPEPLDRIVTRCLAPDPANRYQTTAELEAELSRLDDTGELIPVRRVVGMRVAAVAVALFVGLLGGTWWFASRPEPPAPAPLPVLIADFDNRTNDPLFEGTLEQNLGIAIEQASFITLYPRRDALRLAAQIKPGKLLDQSAARLVAVREGINVILSGSIEQRGNGYAVTATALQPDGKVISTATATASSRDDVLRVIGSLALRMRRALGDTAPLKPGEGEVFTAASLEAARLFYQARELSDGYRNEEAIQAYKRATEIDPNLGRAYAGWANGAFRLGRLEESRDVWKKAIALVDRMTERERYRTVGLYYGTASRNYEKAIENYSALVKAYPSDGAGHNNLALAYLNTMNPRRAMEEGQRALEIYPKNLLYLGNYALFTMYAGDFEGAAKAAERLIAENPTYYPAYLPLAVTGIARADSAAVRDAYERMAKAGSAGRSAATLGLADWAVYEGRFSDAVTALKEGIATDTERKDSAGLVAKYTALAEAYEGAGQAQQAAEAAGTAIKLAGQQASAVLPARLLVRLGRIREAAALASELGAHLQPEVRTYGKVLEGEIAASQGRSVEAIEAFRSSLKLADSWLSRFGLGVAYAQARQYVEALSELELCEKRKGEAVAIFFDELPSLRYLAPLQYWLGRAKEESGMKAAAMEHYKAYLALRPSSPRDPLAVDARRRVAS